MNFSQIINSEENPVKVVIIGDGGGAGGIGSFETDTDGKQVLRIVDAAPHGYDANTDSTRVSVVADKVIKQAQYNFSNVPASTDSIVEIKPPPRTVWKIQNLSVDVASISGSTGSHDIYLRLGANSWRHEILNGTASGTSRIIYARGAFDSGITAKPNNEVLQHNATKGIFVSEDCPLYIVYQNKTNALNSGASYITLSVIEEGEL